MMDSFDIVTLAPADNYPNIEAMQKRFSDEFRRPVSLVFHTVGIDGYYYLRWQVGLPQKKPNPSGRYNEEGKVRPSGFDGIRPTYDICE